MKSGAFALFLVLAVIVAAQFLKQPAAPAAHAPPAPPAVLVVAPPIAATKPTPPLPEPERWDAAKWQDFVASTWHPETLTLRDRSTLCTEYSLNSTAILVKFCQTSGDLVSELSDRKTALVLDRAIVEAIAADYAAREQKLYDAGIRVNLQTAVLEQVREEIKFDKKVHENIAKQNLEDYRAALKH